LDRMRLCWTAASLAVLSAFSVHAQTGSSANPAPAEVVSTAPANASPQSSTEAQIADWIKGAPPLGLSDDDAGGVISAAPPSNGVHGEAGAFVSNRGYGGYVAATMPVGKNAMLGVAISDTQYNGRYFRGNSRSLAASLAIGQPAQRPASCPAGVQIGSRYVEPLWASRIRGEPLADDPDGCFSPAAASGR
jgi:hypothetical protein